LIYDTTPHNYDKAFLVSAGSAAFCGIHGGHLMGRKEKREEKKRNEVVRYN